MKLHALLAKSLLLVLLYGSYLALGGAPEIPRPAETAVLFPDAHGTVYAQPAALISPARQQITLAEQLPQFPVFESSSVVVGRLADFEKATSSFVENVLRRDQWRVASFGSTDIISPFHHFF